MRKRGTICLLAAALAATGCDDGGGRGSDDAIDTGLDTGLDIGPLADSAASTGPDAETPDFGQPDAAAPDVGQSDAASPDAATGPAQCNSAIREWPDGLVELAWDDGVGVSDVVEQGWVVADVSLARADLHEAVRFGLEHPARIHGFAIQYGTLPDDPEAALTAGLYGDFSHNGFDFWAADPLWQGSRCRGDTTPGTWLHYALDEPLEIAHPGLVYVAQRREGGLDNAAWMFDGTPPTPDCEPADCCATFDSCRSSWNLPELTEFSSGGQGFYAWNGLTTTFMLDYMVRLYVEYTDDVAPEEKIFQAVPDVAPSNRMAWGDYDNDGDDDLFDNGPRLLRNDDGAFVDVTEESGITAMGIHGTGVFGDFDNDGCLDVFVFDESNSRPDALLRNRCDGTFEDVTAASGITDLQDLNRCDNASEHAPTPAAAWLDIDGDGFLDLYLANFICWADYSFYVDAFWHNEADGTFADWTDEHGFHAPGEAARSGRGATPVDYDQDGDVDLFVNNYTLHPNLFYRNEGDGTVTEAAADLGLAGRPSPNGLQRLYGHSIGAAWGDLDGDADFDLVVANLAHPRFWSFSDKTEVLIANDEGTFTDLQADWPRPAGEAGLRYQETHSVPVLGDFDHDGDLDLAISAVYEGRPTDFYWGNGDGTFALDAYRTGITVTNGWGMAASDFDRDGDLDLAAQGALFENTAELEGHWLQVRAVGNVRSNRAALGATVRVHAGDRTWIRHVNGGTGQGCQDSLYLHFGLGDVDEIDRLEVLFPGGGEVRYEGPHAVDARLWLYEDGALERGWRADP